MGSDSIRSRTRGVASALSAQPESRGVVEHVVAAAMGCYIDGGCSETGLSEHLPFSLALLAEAAGARATTAPLSLARRRCCS